MAAVEYGDGQEVDNRQVDAEYGEEADEGVQTLLGGLSG